MNLHTLLPTIFISFLIPSVSFAANPIVQGSCKGNFGNTPTSYTSPSDNTGKSEYCFGPDCWQQPIFVNEKGEILFRVNNGGATVLIAKSGSNAVMNWRSGDRSFDSGPLKCQ